MLNYVKAPKSIAQYTLMRGVTDFGNLSQFDLFEEGHSGIMVVTTARFMRELATRNDQVRVLLENVVAAIECEFRGLDGIPDISADAGTISNGINELQLINKVNEDTSIQISMRFWEKSGSLFTKFIEYYLRGIKDPKSQAKHYHGLIASGALEAGFEHEVFSLLYWCTDATYLNLEKAYLFLNAQPITAETSMYNSTKGDIAFREVTVTWNVFPVTGDEVNKAASEVIKFITSEEAGNKRMILDSNNFSYTGVDKINPRA